MNKYDHKEIEPKWEKDWEDKKLYSVDEGDKRPKYYVLSEFPYPSGNLHVGHWYAFALPDIFARKKRMEGKNVLYPFGFDAFGLPAENAAIKRKLDPKKWTYENMDTMRVQIRNTGASFDWSREIATCDPAYFKWTQWIFIQMFKRGLAYKKKSVVNWDPVDKTVLANEQVLPDGTAERSGAKVEKKELEQWFLKITDYAERLDKDLEKLDWPEQIKTLQKNWIGKSVGTEFDFKVENENHMVTVFTTRPDTLFGVTYIVVAPEHEIISKLGSKISNIKEVEKYIKEAKEKDEIERTSEGKEKTGILLKDVFVIHPATKEKLPVWVADYVIGSYGTGAVMAVPAHDERDWEFTKKYNLPIKQVIVPLSVDKENSFEKESRAFTSDGKIINSDKFDTLTSEEARLKITEAFGRAKTTYKLRDWSIGRQRYWGTPVPIVFDPDGKPHAVPEEHLPWLLPEDVDHTPTGESPLARSKEFVERTEKIFGKGWRPESETMDTFVDSSWYYLRYLDPKNDEVLVDAKKIKEWMPVSYYFGGAEHTTLHLLYSRFFYKVLFDMGIVSEDEPYKRRLNRGLILGPDGNKMSKSKGNVINPDELVERLGADTVRLYLAFMGPYNECGAYPWDPNGVVGQRRFIERVWLLQEKLIETDVEETEKLLHKTIKKVTEDVEALKYNTAISQMMIFTNEAIKTGLTKKTYSEFLKIFAPFCPFVAEEIWNILGEKTSIHLEKWPIFDTKMVVDEKKKIAVQINGKAKGVIEISVDDSQEVVEELAKKLPAIEKLLKDQEIVKVVYVPGRIINIVVKV